jgi:hypothetical protein
MFFMQNISWEQGHSCPLGVREERRGLESSRSAARHTQKAPTPKMRMMFGKNTAFNGKSVRRTRRLVEWRSCSVGSTCMRTARAPVSLELRSIPTQLNKYQDSSSTGLIPSAGDVRYLLQSRASVPLAFCLRQIRRRRKTTGTVVLLFTETHPQRV